MFSKTLNNQLILIILFAAFVTGCTSAPSKTAPLSTPTTSVTPTAVFNISDYAFPAPLDPTRKYLFYLHGKLIEDQGIPAVSPDFGEYEYAAILQKLSGYGFIVISEQRSKDTDSAEYSVRVSKQVTALLEAGIPPQNITVVGASKGAGIAIFASHLIGNQDVNFVIMGICNPDTVDQFLQYEVALYGNILSIYDSVDNLAGSCQKLFSFSEGKGLSRHNEIVLHVGTGHGILYKPLDEWIMPVVEWAEVK
jgi:hypothetical protein